MAVGKNITWKKGERESNITFSKILGLLRKGDGNFGEENQDFKKSGWGRISSCREHYTPLVDRPSL